LLALEPAPRPVADVDRLWIVDGTLIPVRDRSVGASSRNYRFSANVQVIIDADPRLVIASARPAPGNKADAHVWRESDLPAAAAGATVIADGAYLGTGLIVPHRSRAGRPLLRGQEEDNAEHRRVRARVEHTFARMKNCPCGGLVEHLPLPLLPQRDVEAPQGGDLVLRESRRCWPPLDADRGIAFRRWPRARVVPPPGRSYTRTGPERKDRLPVLGNGGTGPQPAPVASAFVPRLGRAAHGVLPIGIEPMPEPCHLRAVDGIRLAGRRNQLRALGQQTGVDDLSDKGGAAAVLVDVVGREHETSPPRDRVEAAAQHCVLDEDADDRCGRHLPV
jgi:hypothetical protein